MIINGITMDLRAAILEENSKEHVKKIVQWIGNEPQRVATLIDIFLHDEYRVVQRAAWIVSGVAEQTPGLMQPHIPALVKRLEDEGMPVAVKRNVYRVMQYLDLPEAIHGDLMNHCFVSLASPKESAAARAFAMTILARLALLYPEINNELKLIIEDTLRQEPLPSFKSRARKVLQQIEQQEHNGH